MAVYENFEPEKKTYDTGMDAVVIRQYNGGITGGRSLDYTGFNDEVIKAGHFIVKKKVDNVYEYKPLGYDASTGKYNEIPSDGTEFAGVVVRSRLKGEAVAIMDDGRVNDEAMPYQFKDDNQKAAIKSACPNLIFEHD